MNRVILMATTLMLAGAAHATTWAPSEKTDPLTGDKVPGYEIMSFGTYVYNWPSKYDLVFWPLTDEHWICLNPKNGYAAFNDDFEKVSHKEKQTLREWLGRNYRPSQTPRSFEEKLAWLEQVYRQRKMDPSFWCRFYRLMAYVYRQDEEKSIEHVKKAIPLLEANMKANPEGADRIEVLFLLGEYYRRSGEAEKARDYFAQVKTTKYRDDNGKEHVGHPYFIDLVRDREQPPKGGSPDKPGAGKAKQPPRTRIFRRISRSRWATSMNAPLAVPKRVELSRRVVHIYTDSIQYVDCQPLVSHVPLRQLVVQEPRSRVSR